MACSKVDFSFQRWRSNLSMEGVQVFREIEEFATALGKLNPFLLGCPVRNRQTQD